jgi:hypothetical protein
MGFRGFGTVRRVQIFEDSAPSSAGKRKRQGEEGLRAAKQAPVLREESVLPWILDQGVGSGARAQSTPARANTV